MPLCYVLLVSCFAANAFGQDIGTYTYSTSPNINISVTNFNITADTTATLLLPGTSLISPGSTINYALTLAISENSSSASSTAPTTESLLFLTMPSNSGFENATLVKEWMNCAWVYERVSHDAAAKGQKDDGSCDLTLGKDCVNEILKSMASKDGTTCESRLQGVVVPEVCENALGGSRGNIVAANLTATPTSVPNIPLLLVTSEPHSSSNGTYYAEALTRIWPVVFFQMRIEGEGAATSRAAMKCLRSKNGGPLGEGSTSNTPSSNGAIVINIEMWRLWAGIALVIGANSLLS